MRIRATDFADETDIRKFLAARAEGRTFSEALEVGDNGVGAWGEPTTRGSGPCCALPSKLIMLQGKNRICRVFYGPKSVDCAIRDISPPNVCDLNPDAIEALGLKHPVSTFVDIAFL